MRKGQRGLVRFSAKKPDGSIVALSIRGKIVEQKGNGADVGVLVLLAEQLSSELVRVDISLIGERI